jgi:hypothetical protein
VIVDVAAQCDQAGRIKGLRRDRSLVGPVAAEIEALGRRVGEDVVIGRVAVGNSIVVPTCTASTPGENIRSFCSTCFFGSDAGFADEDEPSR